MTGNPNQHPDEERIDAVDHIIFRELGEQARLKQKMQEWEERKRQQRRLRMLPVVSNIASVAALFVMGLFLQAMLPDTKVATDILPQIEQHEETPPAQTTDSLSIAE